MTDTPTHLDEFADPRMAEDARAPRGDEATVWVAHPSPVALLPALLLAGAFGGAAFRFLPEILQVAIDRTLGMLPWTQWGVDTTFLVLQFAVFAPFAFVLLRMALLRFTRYELTTQRIRICRGILLRKHDEVALHRIRDYIVRRPIFGLFLGYGSIRIVSRDPSVPFLAMEWIPRAHQRSEEVRRHALKWKRAMGYREFDSGALS